MHEYRLEGKLLYHYLSTNSQSEWVISRVFQKTTSASSSIGPTAGKKRPSGASTHAGGQIATTSEAHVTCFSTPSFNHGSLFNLPQPPPPPPPVVVAPVTLNSLIHDQPMASVFTNKYGFKDSPAPLSMPFFSMHGGDGGYGCIGSWPPVVVEDEKMYGGSELDCMWK